MAVKVTAPAPVTGTHTYGPVTLSFEDGVAVVDALPRMVRAYMTRRGYTVKAQRKTKTEPETAHEQEEVSGDAA